MGSDIEGWVEVLHLERRPDFPLWFGIVRIDNLVERNYAMFSNLFGHRDAWGFTPIAANRGFPADVSDEVDYQWFDRRGTEQTWIGYEEIKAIDWEEEAEEEQLWGQDLGRKVRRKDTLTPRWAALFKLIEALAGVYGEEFVRLVAWFDSE